MGKDSLEHCESITTMHLSTLVLRVQFEDWFQVKAGFHQKDTPKRRKGLALSHWISSKRLALWSYGISLFKQNMIDVGDLSLLEARVALLLARLWSAFSRLSSVRILA